MKSPNPDLPCCFLLLPEVLRTYAQNNFPTHRHACGREIIDPCLLKEAKAATRRPIIENTAITNCVKGVYSYQYAYMMIKCDELSPGSANLCLTSEQIKGLVPVRMPYGLVTREGRTVAWNMTLQYSGAARDQIVTALRDALYIDILSFDNSYTERCLRRNESYNTNEMLDCFCDRYHVITDDIEALAHKYLMRKKEGRIV